LSDEVEPYLLRSELVIRTPRGRVVTGKAYGHLQMDAPKVGEGQGTLFG
jgi:Holliday junction DNA helicase RuvB